jgi:hypothetical protein
MIGHPENTSGLSKSIQNNAKTVIYQNHCTPHPSKTIKSVTFNKKLCFGVIKYTTEFQICYWQHI